MYMKFEMPVLSKLETEEFPKVYEIFRIQLYPSRPPLVSSYNKELMGDLPHPWLKTTRSKLADGGGIRSRSMMFCWYETLLSTNVLRPPRVLELAVIRALP